MVNDLKQIRNLRCVFVLLFDFLECVISELCKQFFYLLFNYLFFNIIIKLLKLFNSWVCFFRSSERFISHKSQENFWNYKFKGIIIIIPSYEGIIQIMPLNL